MQRRRRGGVLTGKEGGMLTTFSRHSTRLSNALLRRHLRKDFREAAEEQAPLAARVRPDRNGERGVDREQAPVLRRHDRLVDTVDLCEHVGAVRQAVEDRDVILREESES